MEQLPYSTVVTLVKNMNEKDLYIHIVLHWTADFMITDNNGSVTFHLVVDHLFNHYPHIGIDIVFLVFGLKNTKNTSMDIAFHIV